MLMPAKTRVFVETSIQIARVLAEPKQQEVIAVQLQQADHEFVTSHYVFMEYQRSLIADFASVHRAFQQAKSMGAAIRSVFSDARSFRSRSLVRCGQIVSLVYGEREVVHLADAAVLLELYLQLLLKRTFGNHITLLPDLVHCDLLGIGITRQPDLSYLVADSCRKENAACSLPDFLSEQRAKLQTIADYLRMHPNVIKDQPRVEQLLHVVQNDPRNALGQTSCWTLGDIIILLHVPSDCAVWSLDADFAPLCAALGLPMYTP